MKANFIFWIVILTIACNTKARYLDLNKNEYVNLRKDSVSGYMMNSKTGEPVDLYVDTKTHDTVYGITGEVVNGKIRKAEEGKWIVKNGGDEYKAKSESDNSAKTKVEGNESKEKNRSNAVKWEDEGDAKN